MATLGIRSLTLLVGAGYTGTYFYNNVSLEKARHLVSELLISRQSDTDNASDASPATEPTVGSKVVNELTAQMDRLTREVNRRGNEPVVIIGPSGYKGSLSTVTDVFNLLGWIVFATSLGGAVYYVAVRKRLSIRDLFWVSQNKFNDTVTAMQNGITRVSGVVNSVRRDLGERLKMMEGKVEHVEDALSKQIEAEVGDVKDGVGKLGEEVSDVRRGVDDVSTRVGQMNDKLDSTNYGIHLLLGVVSSLAPDKIKPDSPFYDLKKFMQAGDPTPSAEIQTSPASSGSILKRVSQTGLGILLPFGKRTDSSDDRTPGLIDDAPTTDYSKRRSFDGTPPSWSVG